MILREFVETSIPAYKLPHVLYRYDNFIVNFTDDTEISEYDSISDARLIKAPIMNELKAKGMTIKNLDSLLQKYGWYISMVEDEAIHIIKLHSYDNEEKTDGNLDGLYLHFTYIQPTTITRTGLKAKQSESEDGSFQDKIRYPIQRVYLWKLDGMYKNTGDINLDFAKRFRFLTEILDANDYGNYVYLVKVPTNIKIHYDEEYGKDTPARYITQCVPPSCIAYLSSVSKIKEVIAENKPVLTDTVLKSLRD